MKSILCISILLAFGFPPVVGKQQTIAQQSTAKLRGAQKAKKTAPSRPAQVESPDTNIFAGRLIQPLPAGFEMYLGEPPFGWGNNAVSVSFTNAVPGCYMELIVAGKPGRVLMRSGSAIHEFPGTLYSVQDSQGNVDPASLIPPGETVYFLRDTPAYQSWTATCYVNIPRLVQVSTAQGMVNGLVLQVTSRRPGAFFGGKASVRVNSYDMYDISRFN